MYITGFDNVFFIDGSVGRARPATEFLRMIHARWENVLINVLLTGDESLTGDDFFSWTPDFTLPDNLDTISMARDQRTASQWDEEGHDTLDSDGEGKLTLIFTGNEEFDLDVQILRHREKEIGPGPYQARFITSQLQMLTLLTPSASDPFSSWSRDALGHAIRRLSGLNE